MHRPGLKHAGPTLYTNSLRAWQAQYKARRGAGPTAQSPVADALASRQGPTGGASADGQGAATRGAPER